MDPTPDSAAGATAGAAASPPIVSRQPGALRYVAETGGTRAGLLTYGIRGGKMTLIHTEVDPAFEGHGIAGLLVRAALDDARAADLRIVPACPFAAAYLKRHPEDLDLVDEADRQRWLA